ncbi:hypothetical protein WJX72_000437 [[Myrmecia] bisecta]|uniref:BLUF domain-containing protein n=1 Tax=[Myrmecia] bisecta TaxID=41462 RepID=A0AAW1PN75_9CHLO
MEASLELPEAPVRESLLDVVQSKLQQQGKAVLVTRLVYVAKLTERASTGDLLHGVHKKLLDQSHVGSTYTGILVVFPTCLLHMVEGPTSTILELLRLLRDTSKSETRLQAVTVMSCTEDIPSRAFGKWQTAFVDAPPASEKVEAVDPALLVQTASSVNLGFIHLGRTLAGMTEADGKSTLQSLSTSYSELPSQETLLSIVLAEDAPTLQEFLEIMDTPVSIDLDSEQTWPIPTPLKF